MSGPMMGDFGVALRTGPSIVASFGRGLQPVQNDTARSTLHQSRAAPGFDGVGSIRHRSQNFLRRWVGGGFFF